MQAPSTAPTARAPVAALSLNQDGSSDSNTIVAAVVGSVGAVVALLALAALALCLVQRQRQRQHGELFGSSNQGTDGQTPSDPTNLVLSQRHSKHARSAFHRHRSIVVADKEKGTHTDSSSSGDSLEEVTWDPERSAPDQSGSQTRSTGSSGDRRERRKHRRFVRSRQSSASGIGKAGAQAGRASLTAGTSGNSLTVLSTQNRSSSTVEVHAKRGDALALAHTLDTMAAARPPAIFAGDYVVLKERVRGGQSLVQFARDADAGLHQFAVRSCHTSCFRMPCSAIPVVGRERCNR